MTNLTTATTARRLKPCFSQLTTSLSLSTRPPFKPLVLIYAATSSRKEREHKSAERPARTGSSKDESRPALELVRRCGASFGIHPRWSLPGLRTYRPRSRQGVGQDEKEVAQVVRPEESAEVPHRRLGTVRVTARHGKVWSFCFSVGTPHSKSQNDGNFVRESRERGSVSGGAEQKEKAAGQPRVRGESRWWTWIGLTTRRITMGGSKRDRTRRTQRRRDEKFLSRKSAEER